LIPQGACARAERVSNELKTRVWILDLVVEGREEVERKFKSRSGI
jgi:hypothetical protein